MKRNIYKYLVIMSFPFLFGLMSCNDWFDIKPQSETVFEDFWQNENDVLSMVGSCYRGMNEPDFMDRLIVWGEVRSDNVLRGPGGASDDLVKIFDLTFNASNGYTNWSSFYTVINYCNTVIRNASSAQQKDPNFTIAQLNAYIAEVKGIRALCYFTLVRTFRDIPLITEPTIDDNQRFEMAQSSPDYVVSFLIDDLENVLNDAVTGYGTDINYNKGRITRNAIRALLADMYLFLNDYDNCITYCDEILNEPNSKIKLLDQTSNYAYEMYYLGNSEESIFELQFDYTGIQNYLIYEMYCKSPPGSTLREGKSGYQLSSFKLYDSNNLSSSLFQSDDLRRKDSFYPYETGGFYPIMKYVAVRSGSSTGEVYESNYHYESNNPNWIFYRLPDIYLMKAEALVEKGGDSNLQLAFELVEKTYDRANREASAHSLSFSDYNTQERMRNLVFDERQREFLFEGKRYFDLLRRVNRDNNPAYIVNNYLMRKYVSLDQATVKSKLSDIDALYMPINRDELRNNPLLKQNPYYETSSDSGKK